jgi:23S rRNA (cytosine1962-C5)-methyltransferase
VSDLAPNTPLCGEAAPEELVVNEGPLRFSVALADGLSTGLFIDQRDNRRLVMDRIRGGRLLNLFSYTCSFTVAAAVGGTRESVNVDVSGRALSRGRRNLELNARQFAEGAEAAGNHRLFKEDVLAYLPRALRRDERFDWIVLDPPSFGTGKSKSFRFGRDYPGVARDAFRLLAADGRMLCVANHRGTDLPGFRQMIREAATSAGVKLRELQTLAPPPDCAPDAETSWTKSLLATIA